MDRKESIKTLLFGAVSIPFAKKPDSGKNSFKPDNRFPVTSMQSSWDKWPDMQWTGPEWWGNRLQDWKIENGYLVCAVSAPNRTLHCLTHQLSENTGDFVISVDIEILLASGSEEDQAGFEIGSRAKSRPVAVEFDDYRRNAVFGEGSRAGIDGKGRLFIGQEKSRRPVSFDGMVRLQLSAVYSGEAYELTLSAVSLPNEEELGRLTVQEIDPVQLTGNAALLSHISSRQRSENDPSVRFSNWDLSGRKVVHKPDQTFGPVCFSQYTLDRGVVKMTVQMAPVEQIEGHIAELQLRQGEEWITRGQSDIDPLSRTAHFRMENWDYKESIPYRIRLKLPLKNQTEEYIYDGTIAAEPESASQVKVAVFSCNSHYGFPNTEVVENVTKHQPDMALFLGDQIYESHGGFGVERSHDTEKVALDYLRKWYMFGWSYRDLFRHIPAAFIPDDHDVFHGNIWGEGGESAPTENGWGYEAQDEGGYKYPPEWVNMVERTLTSHLPDPFDSTPIKQGIGVYYTDWVYGGISFAILEDRKFKTAPGNVLPEEAKVVNGFIQNRGFDIKKYYDIDAELLGKRQIDFLQNWVADWRYGAQMKAVLSQTNFCTLATLPEGSILDSEVPNLEIPSRGAYVEGDAPTADMDSNGWPPKERDHALRIIRKGFAFHIAGDQHLASTVQYGVDDYGDAGFAFAGPALNNIWPRRWWPPVKPEHKPLSGRPKNTGNFEDGFGNKMTVYAVANPVRTQRRPALIYDRVTGYGMVVFDKSDQTIRIECWPRYVDPEANPEGQYDGWPIYIRQEDNYGRKPTGYLAGFEIEGIKNPVLELHNQQTGELEYALRISEKSFKPKVFEESLYTIRIGDPDENRWREFNDLSSGEEQTIHCIFD